MEIVVRKDARGQLLVVIQATIREDAKIVRQVVANLVLKPVRMAARIVLPKVRDVRIVVPLVHHRAMIHVKMDAKVIVNLLV